MNDLNITTLVMRRRVFDMKFLHGLFNSAVDSMELFAFLNFLVPKSCSRSPFVLYTSSLSTNVGWMATVVQLDN